MYPKEVPPHVKRQNKERIMAEMKPKPKQPAGSAQAAWERWNPLQRSILLTVWCKAPAPMFEHKSWYRLSLWVRKSVKLFFRQALNPDHPLYSLRYN